MPLGEHRMPQPPAAPPPRPTASLPQDRDEVNIRTFGDEFDAVPLPTPADAKAHAPVCNETNMDFIRSDLPMSIQLDYGAFFERMAKHQWCAARPTVGAACWPRRVERAPMGFHRPATGVDTSKPLYRGPAATDWKKIRELDRVNAYAFRGDKRRPADIRAAGGFHPPSARADDNYLPVIAKRFVKYMKDQFGKDVDPDEVVRYIRGQGKPGKVFVEYEIWRAILGSEKFHIGRMVADEFLRGYISTSRNVNTARAFAKMSSADGQKAPIFAVYALHSEGGFLLPPSARHVHGTKGTEAEIAHPGPIPWRKVMAFRTGMTLDWNDSRTYYQSKVIFVRKGFSEADPRGFTKVVASLGTLDGM